MTPEKDDAWVNRLAGKDGRITSEGYKKDRANNDPPTKALFGDAPSLSQDEFLAALKNYDDQEPTPEAWFDRLTDGGDSLTIDQYEERCSDDDPPAFEIFGKTDELSRSDFSKAADDYENRNSRPMIE